MRSLTRSIGAAAVLETAADTPPTITSRQLAGNPFDVRDWGSIPAWAAIVQLLLGPGESCV